MARREALRCINTLLRQGRPPLPAPFAGRAKPVVSWTTGPGRPYHSYDRPAPPGPFSSPTESAILAASLLHVPAHGFTDEAVALGALDTGHRDVTVNLFAQPAFALVHYHLVKERTALSDRAREILSAGNHDRDRGARGGQARPRVGEAQAEAAGVMGDRIKRLARARLMANRPVIHRWQEALAIMSQASTAPTSVAELARLSDEMWFLAGDASVDTSWYTKRAGLAAIYAAAELFMTQDRSPDFVETELFLDRRLQEARRVGGGVADVGEWLAFTGHALVNTFRAKGIRI